MVIVNFAARLRNCQFSTLRQVTVRCKSYNSHEWLKRRQADPHVDRYKRENYRCRSAFKLIEIIDKFKLISPGMAVLDVGAAPGSWSQVLAERTNSNRKDADSPVGLVIAIDKTTIFEIDGVNILQHMDFTKESSQKKILQVLGSRKLDFVFSDLAPTASGVKCLDQEVILQLVYPVLLFSIIHLRVGGGCLIKIWGGQHVILAEEMRRFFTYFNVIKPQASYSGSSELYLLGRDFLGLRK